MINLEKRFLGCLFGLAVGDAVGTTLEFMRPGTFKPITDMVGGGPFNLEAGQWTDDTSMALCLAHSLVYQKGFNAEDQMNRYCNWWQHGYMSSTGSCFDIGITVSAALKKYLDTNNPFAGSTDPFSSGNGSLMRLAPVAMFYYSNFSEMIKHAGESSRTTHGSEQCIDSCRYFANLLHTALSGKNKEEILSSNLYTPETNQVREIATLNYLDKDESEINGSGYVIESLEAALWCFAKTNNFESAILTAANLGNDADTTAAICGQIAGAYYGVDNIKKNWIEKIAMYDEIKNLSSDLMNNNSFRQN